MRVISLTQPWATLLVYGKKRIETRSWGTAYRGRIAVHAARSNLARELCFTEPFRAALEEVGVTLPGQLPLGALLGWVELVDVRRMYDGGDETCPHQANGPGLCIACDPRLTDRERAFGNYASGRAAWLTGTSRHVAPEPVPFRGSQGLRELPDAVAALL